MSNMANARMWLRCEGCKKAILLSRHYGEPWVIDCPREDVDDFLWRHYPCCKFDDMHEKDFSLAWDGDDFIPEQAQEVKE